MLALLCLVAGCADGGGGNSATACDPAAFAAVRAQHDNRAEVTVCGPVVRVNRLRRTRSGTHRVFYVGTGGTQAVQVDANVDILGNFPIRTGQHAVVRGEYYYDGSGRDGVHWTHRTDRGTHPPGFVQLDGVTYQ